MTHLLASHHTAFPNCESIRFHCNERKAHARTIVNVYVRPEVFACADGSRLAAVERCADKRWNLNGMRVLNPFIDEYIRGYPVNGAWENDVALKVTFRDGSARVLVHGMSVLPSLSARTISRSTLRCSCVSARVSIWSGSESS